ncbi:HNH endonuclease [Pseudomonas sp. CR3202]|uniref:HNH endonuclease n=1 Tax=Pseudomonas sp. CR3202 TaxID=3351532 RepID=UPI003BF29A98
MSRALIRHRFNAYINQSGRCFYCGVAMWLKGMEGFAHKHHMSLRQAWRFKCTAEHLVARCDGGGDEPENIVAACSYCNCKRHDRKQSMSSDHYRRYVLGRLQSRRWHQDWVYRCAGDLLPASSTSVL